MKNDKILAFFEDKHSLSFNYWFKELKNGDKVLYLRPFIKISNPTDESLKLFLKHFDIKNKNILTSIVSTKTMFKHKTINIQTMDDAEVFVSMYKEYIFLTERARKRYDRFVKCFNYVKEIGNRHDVYNDELEKFLDLKFNIKKVISGYENSHIQKRERIINKMKLHLQGFL